MFKCQQPAHAGDSYANGACRPCAKARAKKWADANPERRKAIFRKANHKRAGIPAPTRPMPATCELCGSPPKVRALHLDHDHDSGRFRGWLCTNCNTSLGKLGDSVTGLQRAIEYLQKGLN